MKYVRGVKRVTKPSSTLCVLCAPNSVCALGAVVGMAREASTKAIATLHKSTVGGRKRIISECTVKRLSVYVGRVNYNCCHNTPSPSYLLSAIESVSPSMSGRRQMDVGMGTSQRYCSPTRDKSRKLSVLIRMIVLHH